MPNHDGTGPRHDCTCGQRRGQGRGFGRGSGRNGQGNGLGNGRGQKGRAHQLGTNTAEALIKKDIDVMTGLIAVSAKAGTIDADVDPRFGRAAGFLLVDEQGTQKGYVDNSSSDSMAHGAGLAAVEAIAKAGAKVVMTGHVGPKAAAALSAAGIRSVEHCEGQTVAEAVNGFLAQATEAAK